MIETFKNFYFYQTNQKLDIRNNVINGNINIIYFDENENQSNVEKLIQNKKIFNLQAPKSKILINIFVDEFIYKLKKVNYMMNGRYRQMLIEYIYKVIKCLCNNVSFYRSLCNFKIWMNKFIDVILISRNV